MAFPWGAAISAAGSLAGGLLNLGSQKKAQKQQQQAFNQNMQFQRDLGKSAIQWRVKDAKEAGIHPLYALGTTPSFSPVSAAFRGEDYGFVGRMGQDIGKAVNRIATHDEREANAAYTRKVQQKTLTNMDLRNGVLAARLTRLMTADQPPAPPKRSGNRWLVPGQGDSVATMVKDIPLERVAGAPGRKDTEAGAVTSGGYLRTRKGYTKVRSRDAAERMEDDHIGNVIWGIANRILPFFGINEQPPPVKPPKGTRWKLDYKGDYVPMKRGPLGIYFPPKWVGGRFKKGRRSLPRSARWRRK